MTTPPGHTAYSWSADTTGIPQGHTTYSFVGDSTKKQIEKPQPKCDASTDKERTLETQVKQVKRELPQQQAEQSAGFSTSTLAFVAAGIAASAIVALSLFKKERVSKI